MSKSNKNYNKKHDCMINTPHITSKAQILFTLQPCKPL